MCTVFNALFESVTTCFARSNIIYDYVFSFNFMIGRNGGKSLLEVIFLYFQNDLANLTNSEFYGQLQYLFIPFKSSCIKYVLSM